MSLASFCVKNPVSVTVGVILVMLFGTLALFRIPIQLTPDVDIPTITVETTWIGRGPQEIEREIVDEQERFLKNVEGVVKMKSESQDGIGRVILEFRTGMDMTEALIRVENSLSQVPTYPDDADKPVVASSGANDNAIAWFVLKSKRPDDDARLDTLRDFCENEIKPALERIPGVARSNVLGGREREMRVEVDPGLLAAKDLSFLDVREALVRDNANVSGGDFEEGKRRYVVRVLGEFRAPEEIERVVVARRDGVPVQISDVGTVALGYKRPDFSVRNTGAAAIAINAMRDIGANVVEVMHGLKGAVAGLNEGLLREMDLELEQVHDETEYITESIDRVRENIFIGSILAALTLLFFLRSISATAVIGIAIPICAVGTFLAVTLLGRTINVVMLAGISFAVGMVVDNAIVVLENIDRRRLLGDSPADAAVNGAREVQGAVISSTLTTLAVFLPVIFNEGEAAQLFRDIAIAISAGVGLSLIVSLTVVPSYAAPMMGLGRKKSTSSFENRGIVARFADLLARFVQRINSRFIGRFGIVAALTVISLFTSIALMPDTEYLPTGNRNLIFGVLLPPPGYNLDELTRIGHRLEDDIRPLWSIEDESESTPPAIRNFFYVARGRSVFMGASARTPRRAAELVGHLQAPLSKIPGMFAFVQQSSLFARGLTEGRTIDIDLTGADLERLVGLGGRVFGMARAVFPPGTQIRPIPSLDLGSPEVRLVPDRYRMSELGLRNRDLGFLMDVFVDGAKVSDFKIGSEEIDLVLVSKEDRITHAEQLGRAALVAAAEHPVTFGDVADIRFENGPEQINHIERDRVITIQVSPPATMPLESAMRTIREQIEAPLRRDGSIGTETRLALTGTADKLSQTKESMKWNFVLAIAITYLLMSALFSSFVHPFIIMFSVPLGWVGGVVGLDLVNRFVTTQNLDVITMLGFVILVGTVVNNAILIVDRALVAMRESGVDANAAVADAVRTRTRPMLMTVLTSVLGMAPLVLAPGSGSELYRGLGAVVVGGLLCSTIFTFLVIPALFVLIDDLRRLLGRLFRRSQKQSAGA